MIAIDTNILLRYLLEDDEAQAKKAASLILGHRSVLVTDVVLVEMMWTLRGKKYQLDKEELIKVIQALFQEPNICFEDGQAVWTALHDYRTAEPIKGKVADFADALIINKAKQFAKNRDETFEGTYTFDVAAQALPGAKAPA